MTPNEFLRAKERMLRMLSDLRQFELGESAAIVLLLAVTNKTRQVCYSDAIGYIHGDAATKAIQRLRDNEYLWRWPHTNGNYKYYMLSSKGYDAAMSLVQMLEMY